jgi:hypothetical protein
MVFQMLLCGECFENVCILRRTNYPSVKVLNGTLATQQHLEYHCEALYETPCITSESNIEP